MPITDAVVHEIAMRWADIDSLNHVNNVVYVDYASEARAVLGEAVADAPVRSMSVRFLQPLLLSREPVAVASAVDGATVTQQIRRRGSDAVFAEIRTELGALRPIPPHPAGGMPFAMAVRRSDLDQSGNVSLPKLFQLVQELRILFVSEQVQQMQAGRFVVGTVAVEQARPVPWRAEPYAARARLTRVGAGSITIESEILDEDAVLVRSTSVMVGFDAQHQRSRRLDDDERAIFEATLDAS
ncbi:acyl-CoA thioesterase [Aeromicrobium wangtongii]|uniref:Acyl-[acyl-carrier-protein] thioesterase n=1 Tax=Aeromicrobium wangtongii TaxID=2969247 RepID=A0ABY5MB88_9ACTN|nr:acyl-[acyl-carrier-protein] thioesterase [Aeromicrobium wangtongii]MCD9197221.1 acyl-[acyl-carrier-protein] thioesterase [Aeromicrobium wangtongii]UUP14717.1 acyl-[acyl-carrier-protein] thioesterase [Aeromicrobium wangtongii]